MKFGWMLSILLGCLLWQCQQAPTTYYVDSAAGDDTAAGTSEAHPWASLEKVNQTVLRPGDKVLFKAGSVYKGQLHPQGSGVEGQPILCDVYGEGPAPRMEGEGLTRAAVWLDNVAYWELHNLEVTNTGAAREAGRTGVMVSAKDVGDLHHIYLDGLAVHHVNGSLVKKDGGGSAIYWQNGGDSIPSRFIDLRIENCHIYDCGRNAIIADGYASRDQWYPSLEVQVRHNLLERIPGDGIVPIGCDGAVIEYNTMRDSPDILSHEEAAAGIWPWSCDNTLIQYNEVSGHQAKWDGQGFDADWNCRNTIIQYNYSHDNAGGFLLICNNGENINSPYNIGTEGTIVRYNVSVNDGLRAYPTTQAGYFSPVFHITGPCRDTRIYNNIIYILPKPGKDIDRRIVEMGNWGGPWPEQTVFTNNIFYALDTATFHWGEDIATVFSNNVFYGQFQHLPEDAHALYTDPRLQAPDQVRGHGFSVLAGFHLTVDSPCMNAGKPVKTETDLLDFFGNPVGKDTVDIGIHEIQLP